MAENSTSCPQCNSHPNRFTKDPYPGHEKCQLCSTNTQPAQIQPVCRPTEVIKIKTEWVNKLTHQKVHDELSNDSNILTIDTDHESNDDDSEKPQKSVEIATPSVRAVRKRRKADKRKSFDHIVERSDSSLKIEKQKTVYHCTICDKTFGNRKLRLYHLYCNKDIANPFKCADCSKTFKNTFHLNWHRAKVHKGTTLTYRCEVCDKAFPTKHELKRHLKFHSRRDFQCHQCTEAFPSRAELHEHSLTHDKADFKFTCAVCKAKFRLKSNYAKHVKTHEKSRSTRVKCDRCDRVFANRANMLVHAKKHSDHSQLTCNICDKYFSDRATLLRHNKQHQAKVGYYCKLCDMKSKRKDNIMRHCRSFHPEKVGNFVGVVEKVTPVEVETPKEDVKPPVNNRVSVIMTVGRPGRKLTEKVDATVKAPVQSAVPKPVEATKNLEIYRKILAPYPAKPTLPLSTSLPAVSVTPRDRAKNYDPLEIYRKILGPSKPVDPVESQPVPAAVEEEEPKSGVAPSAQFNFTEVHWRKRTSQNLMFK